MLLRIKPSRKAIGWTQEQLGKELGLGPTSILRIERGHTPVTIDRVYTISQLLETPLIQLLPEEYEFEQLDMMLGSTNRWYVRAAQARLEAQRTCQETREIQKRMERRLGWHMSM